MMTDENVSNADRRVGRQLRSILLMTLFLGLAIAAFIAAAPLLRTTIGAPMMAVVSVALMVFVLGASEYFAQRFNRGLDEVQRAAQGVATRWGASVGQIAFIFLLMAPPFQDAATALVNQFAADSGTSVDGKAVVFAMVVGFGSLVLLQTLGTFVVGVIWWKRSQQ